VDQHARRSFRQSVDSKVNNDMASQVARRVHRLVADQRCNGMSTRSREVAGVLVVYVHTGGKSVSIWVQQA
jgi:hypothetical protein